MSEVTAISLILEAGPVVRAVLFILLSFSVFTWAIIVYKWRFFSRMQEESSEFKRIFIRNKNHDAAYQILQGFTNNPMANLFRAALADETMSRNEVRIELKRVVNNETANIEKYLSFLATTGSTAPFIGLFGTVWGIMDSFTGIGKTGSASLATVAPGIAEALIATAAGLAAAIPAVIAFNFYLEKVKKQVVEMEDFSEELVDYHVRRSHATSPEKTNSFRD
jgi:biopolymer transport protein TolQ